MSSWDAAQYLKFGAQRTQPSRDLAALTPELQQEFEKDVLDGVKQAYPVQKDGSVIFPFPRLFFLGVR